ncbi:hypothetical protein GCM10027072_63350 [Streptomyces bullii]
MGGVLAVAGLLAASGCLSTPHYSTHRTYYISPQGDDRRDGLSPDEAWRSLKRLTGVQVNPGDRVLLKAGGKFAGPLELRQDDAGRADRPVTIGSYGTGRAVIDAAGTHGIAVYRTAGVDVRDLIIVGKGASYTGKGGIHLYSDLPDDRKLDRVTVSGVDVSGFRVGIQVGGAAGRTGFKNVTVSNSVLHDNRDMGLFTFGPRFNATSPVYAHENVRISRVETYNVMGDPSADDHHTGNGIVLSSVNGATVAHSSAHDNGARASKEAGEGPVGIWAFDATRVVLQHNTAYRQNSGSKVDGAGFGLDRNVSRSVIQYNLAFGNDGPGFQTYTNLKNGAHTNNVFRYNVSSDNGRLLPHRGGISIQGKDIRDLYVYQNTVVLTNTAGQLGPAVRVTGEAHGVVVRNNLLVTDASPVAVMDEDYSSQELSLQGNNYFSTDRRPVVLWDDQTYRDLNSWREETRQESVGGRSTGLSTDPCFSGGAKPIVSAPDKAALLVPKCNAMEGKGVSLNTPFTVDPSFPDYFGKPTGTPPPVGAMRAR